MKSKDSAGIQSQSAGINFKKIGRSRDTLLLLIPNASPEFRVAQSWLVYGEQDSRIGTVAEREEFSDNPPSAIDRSGQVDRFTQMPSPEYIFPVQKSQCPGEAELGPQVLKIWRSNCQHSSKPDILACGKA